jgi:hypothetical protein
VYTSHGGPSTMSTAAAAARNDVRAIEMPSMTRLRG